MLDQDGRQEYECLVLEGFSQKEAAKLAQSANNDVNRRRIAGPRTADKNGHGQVPYISDMTNMDIFENAPSVTQDTRTDAEREEDWAMQESIGRYLDLLTPLQRAVIVDLYGLETGEPMTYRAVSRKHGHGDNPGWASKRRDQAVRRIRTMLANPPLTEAQRAAKRRKQRTEQKRRARARKKNVV